MLNKLAKLINVKSIVTLVLTGVFSYLAITGKNRGRQLHGHVPDHHDLLLRNAVWKG